MTRNDAADWLRRNLPEYTIGMTSRRFLEEALATERELTQVQLREASTALLGWPWEEMDLGDRRDYILRDVRKLRAVLDCRTREPA